MLRTNYSAALALAALMASLLGCATDSEQPPSTPSAAWSITRAVASPSRSISSMTTATNRSPATGTTAGSARMTAVRHESGHVPFGLADEYCWDGGYFQATHLPNIYRELFSLGSQIGCAEDAINVGRTAADCRSFEEDGFWFLDSTWYTSDPDALTPCFTDGKDDIMADEGPLRALDLRRIEWVYDNCSAASC